MPNPKAQLLLDLLAELPDATTLVEMGCIRSLRERPEDGFSTVYLARIAQARDGMLYSIDLDQWHLNIAGQAVRERSLESWASFIQGDGPSVLELFGQRIDFLYLDGPDDPEVTLAAFQSAEYWLAYNAVVCLDDCHTYNNNLMGKGSLAIPYAMSQGWNLEVIPTYKHWQSGVLRH